MEKIKKRTSKYEISINLKNNGYYLARISFKLGGGSSPRIENSGTTEELALIGLLNKMIKSIAIAYDTGQIHTIIDDRVSQRLVKSINDLGLNTPEVTTKTLVIIDKINSINSKILNNIYIPSNIVPIQHIENQKTNMFLTNNANNETLKENNNSLMQKIVISELVQEWLDYRLSLCIKTDDNPKPIQRTTVDNNFYRIRDDILPFFAKNKIMYFSQITVEHIKSLIKSIKCQNSKHKTYVVMNMIFKYAISKNIVKSNLMEKVEKPPEKIRTGKDEIDNNYIEPDNQKRWLDLFEKENTDMSLLFETMLLTGLRPEEACGLKWKAFNVDENKLVINNAYKSFNLYNDDMTKVIGHYSQDSSLKTPNSYRDVPILQERLRETLLKHKQYQQELFKKSRAIKNSHHKWTEDEYIFLGRNYHPYIPDSLAYGLTKFRKKYGLTKKEDYVSPYGLRRSFASYWSWKGMKKVTLMHLMGHSNYETTVQHYIKISTKQIREEMQQLEEAS